MSTTLDLGLVKGVPGTSNITDDILETKHTIATNSGVPYIAPNENLADRKYISLKGDSYGECATSRSAIGKYVAIPGFRLVIGNKVTVRFTDNGESNPLSGTLTLDVNSTGAKPIIMAYSNREEVTADKGEFFCNNMVKEFVYDGECWVCVSPLNVESPDILDSVESVKNNTQPGKLAGALALKEAIEHGGIWLGSQTIASGSTTKVITDASINATSIIDVYYSEESKSIVQDAVASYAQETGKLTISFGNALESDATISNVKVVNP